MFSEGSLLNGAGGKFTSREYHLSKWLLVRKGCEIAEKPESAKLPVDVKPRANVFTYILSYSS